MKKKPLTPLVKNGGYMASKKYTPLVYPGGKTTGDAATPIDSSAGTEASASESKTNGEN